MKKLKTISLSLILGGTLILAGCSFQFQTKRGEKTAGEVVEKADKTAGTEEKTTGTEEKVIEAEELAATHTVIKGETLWDIAGYEQVYGDSTKWKLIYEANKDILDSPDSLKPGQMLIIPRE